MRKRRHWWAPVLLVPFVALLWVPAYNRSPPELAGFPFFYIWQLGWIVLTALLVWFVFRRWRA